ncbi:cation/multidrug efflux pump [Simiduia curdlanivorans]|uniref:Cation/multidrug efflux pump n=1 Tax=Simiduia curdlanivorans TaxID=1492769 RepID=A0ABV8VA10_9GAMM|nr:cation/multidrug efflux pump [Simiduia curdlanivorans]MDN3639695.1 cation/multidrug efflux pump [Simiduia curdlanivorans]
MFYYFLATLIVILGLVAVYFAIKLLSNTGWLLGWLKGMVGLALFAIAALFVLVAFDLLGYKHVLNDKPIATLSFERLGPQSYRAILVESDGVESRFDLSGDQWQLDARIIRWSSLVAAWGVKPAYRLDRLAGRYYSLEKERQNTRTVYSLIDTETDSSVDVWPVLQASSAWLPIDAQYGSATYLPMDDGALYSISLSYAGLVSKPLNERAEAAVKRWQ